MSDFASLPPDLPVPEDDGGADHLPGAELPSVSLPVAVKPNTWLSPPVEGLTVAFTVGA